MFLLGTVLISKLPVSVTYIPCMVYIPDANLQEYENMESMPRPEEDREIEIEKNKRLQQQLKVIGFWLADKTASKLALIFCRFLNLINRPLNIECNCFCFDGNSSALLDIYLLNFFFIFTKAKRLNYLLFLSITFPNIFKFMLMKNICHVITT